MIFTIFAKKVIKWKICQNSTKTPEKHKISLILDQIRTRKIDLNRGINENIRRFNERFTWYCLTKDTETH